MNLLHDMLFMAIMALLLLTSSTALASPQHDPNLIANTTNTTSSDSLSSGITANPGSPLSPAKIKDPSCWFGKQHGCGVRQVCWTRCGANPEDGFWCWLGIDKGKGEEAICSSDDQCDPRYLKELGCTHKGCAC